MVMPSETRNGCSSYPMSSWETEHAGVVTADAATVVAAAVVVVFLLLLP